MSFVRWKDWYPSKRPFSSNVCGGIKTELSMYCQHYCMLRSEAPIYFFHSTNSRTASEKVSILSVSLSESLNLSTSLTVETLRQLQRRRLSRVWVWVRCSAIYFSHSRNDRTASEERCTQSVSVFELFSVLSTSLMVKNLEQPQRKELYWVKYLVR